MFFSLLISAILSCAVFFCCVRFIFSVISQEIGWEEGLQNDLFHVELDIKPNLSNLSGPSGTIDWAGVSLSG